MGSHLRGGEENLAGDFDECPAPWDVEPLFLAIGFHEAEKFHPTKGIYPS
jgi:hypothetical protein